MKKVCVVTVSRADYGLLRWVIQGINNSPVLHLQLVVSGAHFSVDQGNTVHEIRDDGFPIAASVPIVPARTEPLEITEALGQGLSELGKVFEDLQPDVLVLLGDRSETMVAAVAATIAGIPIAHIHGGEVTLGAIDDAFRHSITKMSSLHFVAREEYRDRVIQMGEDPETVFVAGALGHESIRRTPLLSRQELEAELGIKFGQKNFLVTVHPETADPRRNAGLLDAITGALRRTPDAHLFVTASNTDEGGEEFNSVLRGFVAESANAWFFESLGTRRYLSLMSQVDAVVGNSSSGIHEAPALQIPTVDVGDRQAGRLSVPSIFSTEAKEAKILDTIGRALEFKSNHRTTASTLGKLSRAPSSLIIHQLKVLLLAPTQ